MMLDVSYIGNRGSRLNHHFETLGVDANMNHPDVLLARLGAAAVEHQLAAGTGGEHPDSLRGIQRQRRPGAAAVAAVSSHRLARRAHREEPVPRAGDRCSSGASLRGLQARVGYTFSRLKNNGAETGQGNDGRNGGIQNPANPLEWRFSDDDTPHVLLAGFSWEVPGPTSGAASWFLGGWNVAGILRYESGRPLGITMNNDLGGLLFNTQKRPNKTGGEGEADIERLRSVHRRLLRQGRMGGSRARCSSATRPSVTGDVRGFPNYSEDINIFKVFPVGDQKRIRFEAQIGNLFNRIIYCTPNENWSSHAFGQVFTQCNFPRSAQFGFRFDF